ncbi:MAG: M14 metallopeptidase family protein [Gemmatimonadota bacterium]
MQGSVRCALWIAATGASLTAPVTAQQEEVPTPEAFLGHAVGADRRLADWSEVTGYLEAVAGASPRVTLDTLGQTTLGRPFVMLTISSPRNLARVDRLREVQRKLADPRTIGPDEDIEALIAEGRTIVLITASIHSTEVGSSQVPMSIVHRLASSTEAREARILDDVILLLVPSLNPDGVDLVVDWYERTLGEEWEGAAPPFLYHHYVGHDNNRDWYAFTQAETRLAIEYGHNDWHPQIVHDIHQQGSRGSRFFLPPWIDPFEPNVDPLLVQAINDLGTHMAWRLGMEGKKGVVVNATYDAWTPARAYQHYHGGVRILSETASANMASPIELPADTLTPGRNFDARKPSWNFPDPWPGGAWGLGDIVDYMESGAMALLDHAAANRETWLRNFLAVGERAVAGWEEWPAAWVIPADQRDPAAVGELLRILRVADVEVYRAGAPFTITARSDDAAGFPEPAGAQARAFGAGTYVVPMRQPYASFAQTVLERQDYPDLRQYPGGPPRAPYDVTAHTLPLLLGVDAVPAAQIDGGLEALALSAPVAGPEDPGAVLAEAGGGLDEDDWPRIAVYRSHRPSMDEGWTRWILDTYGIPYASVEDADVRGGGLSSADVLLLPSQGANALRAGLEEGANFPEYVGGLGEEGAAAIEAFVSEGGRLVALEEASAYAIDVLDLPVRDGTNGLGNDDFFIPGSILGLDVAPDLAEDAGVPERMGAWFERGSMALRSESADVTVLARYDPDWTLLSGWALGVEHVAGAGALAVTRVGEGDVWLFGFRPQYRGQTRATFPLLFEALRGRRGTPAS